jgi:hypothetical protein
MSFVPDWSPNHLSQSVVVSGLVSQIVFALASVSLWAWVLWRFKMRYVSAEETRYYWASLVFKILATFCVGFVFFHLFSYQTDPERAFEESIKVTQLLQDHPQKAWDIFVHNWSPVSSYSSLTRTYFFVKILAALNLVTGGSFWINGFWLSLFCFLAAWKWCLEVKKHFPQAFMAALLAFLFVLTTVFWSSGLLKESLCLGTICLLSGCFLRVYKTGRLSWKTTVVSLLSALLLYKIKFYDLGAWLLLAVPCLLSKETVQSLHKKGWLENRLRNQVIVFVVFLFAVYCGMNLVCKAIYGEGIAGLMYYTHQLFLELSPEKVNFRLGGISTDGLSFLPYVHRALYHGLYSPQIWEASSWLSWAEIIPNTLSLGLSVWLVGKWVLRRDYKFDFLIVAVLFYVAITACFMAFSAPNFGSLARYKVVYMPFLHFLLLLACFRKRSTLV